MAMIGWFDRLSRGCFRNRDFQRCDEAGAIVLQDDLAVVEVSDGLDQGEAEPGALGRAARIEPPEAPQRLAPSVLGDPRSAVRHPDREGAARGYRAHVDLAASAVANRVFDEVADRLRE